uniref:Uncharacterized protein n=1 Tax=Mucochytrium quahogii TaxID=96639 RepID=A0A7S2RPL1_9STRA|mmetsp:Transcript_7357/g.11753  ORF Transcript_7357/g.11753 Transcript_7357/m.11753 type:complete len:238 (-) Transcript_7357:230-943(-)|eukprot:CAMPEP_0203789898 /NCGR_PEP_ID=MMETSP0100_2-20121128/3737_1 /ASSEMBLY_ACC=CAM_ASM_000210 /TAXON_ID=96639 /ORGANISM=" , Strain NY0313808BC1" /LENGTH=237 /DNA_ID=CAMNT_0050692961 /DNA_START=691 /DNA_END=1404 /DNA_ORIENTATION=-
MCVNVQTLTIDTQINNSQATIDPEYMDDSDWIGYTFDIPEDQDAFVRPNLGQEQTTDIVTPSPNLLRVPNTKRERPEGFYNEYKPIVKEERDVNSIGFFDPETDFNDVSTTQELLSSATEKMVRDTKQRKLLIVPDDEKVYTQGRWRNEEMIVLLHVSQAFIAEDLRVIGDIAYFCGVQRPRRAIDKQLKRMLKYDRWANRNIKELEQQIKAVILEQPVQTLTPSQASHLQTARTIW